MVTRARAVVVAVAAAAAACQGSGSGSSGSGGSGGAAPAADARHGAFGSGGGAVGSDDGTSPGPQDPGSDDSAPPVGSGSARAHPDEPELPAPGNVIAELGAVPAWQAVVDRTHYLLRRAQHGVVYGVVGGPVMVPPPIGAGAGSGSGSGAGSAAVDSGYAWLADDTDGNGALAIRCAFDASARPKPGARVAVGGAWLLDGERRWVWKADAVTALPPAPAPATPPLDPPQPPGHAIAVAEHLPAGAHTISVAKDGELAYFQVVGYPPAVDGDGWPVADELGNPVYALLNLPGERATYGAQDMRAPDERWALRRGVTYVVRLGHIRKHAPDKPASINARSAPLQLK
jgi:hypothetical protein|nr:hypothetical protein [Kofleriaceae bacterium]